MRILPFLYQTKKVIHITMFMQQNHQDALKDYSI
jgi:hypothetical protein